MASCRSKLDESRDKPSRTEAARFHSAPGKNSSPLPSTRGSSPDKAYCCRVIDPRNELLASPADSQIQEPRVETSNRWSQTNSCVEQKTAEFHHRHART